jgi:hypothetical protein
MAAPATPQNFYVQTADAKVFLSWSLTAGATSYSVSRSTDGVTFAELATPSVNSYLDEAVSTGTQYYYKIAAVNGDGTGVYSAAQGAVPCPPGEVSLGAIRLMSQQRADRVNSNFVPLPEWNDYIRQSCYELYDLLINTYEDYYAADPLSFTTDGSTQTYPLPNGANYDGAEAFYKLLGVDLSANSGQNGWVSVKKFMFADRNKYYFPNTASQAYGVYNLAYRLFGSGIQFIPNPTSGQTIRIWYAPRLPALLQDTDVTTISISGWIEYVIVDAAIKALQKEESDVSILLAQKAALKVRIEAGAQNRDAGQPDTISDTRASADSAWGGYGNGFQGGM